MPGVEALSSYPARGRRPVTPERWRQVKGLLESLLELPLPEREQQLLRDTAGDDDLRREVNSLLHAHVAAPTGFLTPTATDPGNDAGASSSPDRRIGSTVGAYRLLGELGHGGMGIVYRAARADGQYAKEVALKLVRAGAATAAVVERFRSERQTLANLEHPNIARLLDGGSTDDGLPFLVMELVDGVPIDAYCEAHQLSVDERLRLFRQVCGAVQFAHGHLVAHRDIKPNNILVANDGTPKLLDFGIAKLVDPGHELRATLIAPLTPEYASPEQIRGEVVTAATDIYSLGVVLYRLLTGASPFEHTARSAHELARSICEAEPTPPSQTEAHRPAPTVLTVSDRLPRLERAPPVEATQLRRRLRGDLDAIVLRALRKEPERRYASVDQFSDDIRRHLERLPVLARRGSRAYRTRRFIARHRFGLAAAITIALTLCAGIVATLRQSAIARANAARAERRFADVRNLATSFLFEFHDSIERLPGSTPTRKLIVSRALGYLDGLSAEAGGDPSLTRELAAAYEKLGDVQGSPYQSNVGDYRGALTSYEKALALQKAVDQGGAAERFALARIHGKVGELGLVTGDATGAKLHYDQEHLLLSANGDHSADFRRELATLDMRYSRLELRSHEVAQALDHDTAAIALLDELLRDSPNDPRLRRSRAVAGVYLGDSYEIANRPTESLAAYEAALALFAPLVESSNAQSLRDAALASARMADVLATLGKREQALDLQHRATAQDELAARLDPANAQARRDVYIDYFKVASLQADLGHVSVALATQRQCVALVEQEVLAVPSSVEIRGDRAEAYWMLGKLQRRDGQLPAAAATLRQALEMYEALAATTPEDLSRRDDVYQTLSDLADLYVAIGDSANALDALSRALANREHAAAASADDLAMRASQAALYGRLGRLHVVIAERTQAAGGAPEWLEAERSYERAFGLWNALEERHGMNPQIAAVRTAALREWRSAVTRRAAARTPPAVP
jgi:serine/threonine protein kinase